MATFALSFRYRKLKPAVFYSSLAAFILVLFQGWLGGQVVKTGLNEWLITLHMLLAMIIMMVLIYAVFKASQKQLTVSITKPTSRWLFIVMGILITCTFVQLILGTQVREMIDVLKNLTEPPPRETWISRLGLIDEVHRSFSWLVLIAGAAVFYLTRWWTENNTLTTIGSIIFGLILLQIATGVGLWYLALPPVYQVVHLTGVAFLIGFEFLLLLLIMNSDRTLPNL